MANRRPAGSGFDLLSSLRSFEVFEKVQTDEHFSGFGAFGGSDEPVSAHGIDEFAVRSAIIRKPSPGSLKNNILCNNLESSSLHVVWASIQLRHTSRLFNIARPTVKLMIGVTVRVENEATQLHRGDADAIVPLFRQYQQPLYGFLLHMVRQPDIAEDLLQKTWLQTIEHIHSYDPNRSFKAWLFAVARNLAIDHLRIRQPLSLDNHLTDLSETVFIEQLHEPGPNALELLVVREHVDLVWKIMAELPAILYEVFKLRFMEEMKLVEIADFLVLPLNTVKTRLYRALEKFHQAFRRKAEWDQNGLFIYS